VVIATKAWRDQRMAGEITEKLLPVKKYNVIASVVLHCRVRSNLYVNIMLPRYLSGAILLRGRLLRKLGFKKLSGCLNAG